MSDGDAERRNAIIARLEVLQFELRVESIRLYETADPQGNSAIGVTATPLPDGFNCDGQRELWKLSALLVRRGLFVEGDQMADYYGGCMLMLER